MTLRRAAILIIIMEWVQKSDHCEGKNEIAKIPKGCIDINNVAVGRWQAKRNAEWGSINCWYTTKALGGFKREVGTTANLCKLCQRCVNEERTDHGKTFGRQSAKDGRIENVQQPTCNASWNAGAMTIVPGPKHTKYTPRGRHNFCCTPYECAVFSWTTRGRQRIPRRWRKRG